MSVNERIKKIQEHYFPNNQKGFAEKIGLSNSTFTDIVKNGNEPSFKTTLKIIQNYPELNVNWLFKGEGQMFSEANEKNIGYGKRFFPMQNVAGEEASEYNAINKDWNEDDIIKKLQDELRIKDGQIIELRNLFKDMINQDELEKKIKKVIERNEQKPIQQLQTILSNLQKETLKKARTVEEEELVVDIFASVLQKISPFIGSIQ